MSRDILLKRLKSVDGRPYPKYSEINGSYSMGRYSLHVDDHGSLSRPASMRISVSIKDSEFPEDTFSSRSKEIALRDLIARRFWESCRTDLKNVYIPRPGQEILERGSVRVHSNHIEIAFSFDLPVKGKNVSAGPAERMFETLDDIVSASLSFRSYKRSKLYHHIHTAENASTIRSMLSDHKMTAFIANGSVLPRREDGLAPMIDAVPFISPKEMEISFSVPNGEPIVGMGIPKGMTAIMGSTGSGKTVLMDAIASGVHNHIPGDGREYVVTERTAIHISASKGRSVENVDALSFINTPAASKFSSPCISGAISQLVMMAEAAEIGCNLFLLDEGSSHPSIIDLDDRIKDMMPEEQVVPLTDMFHSLASAGISLVVATNSEGFISAADHVVKITYHVPSTIRSETVRSAREYKRPEPRYPIVSNNDIVAVEKIPNDIVIPTDVSYACSLIRVIERMHPDGTKTLRSISEEDQDLGPEDVAVRGTDIAMILSRLPKVSMIRRSQCD